jgi:hypothetical protein
LIFFFAAISGSSIASLIVIDNTLFRLFFCFIESLKNLIHHAVNVASLGLALLLSPLLKGRHRYEHPVAEVEMGQLRHEPMEVPLTHAEGPGGLGHRQGEPVGETERLGTH